MTPSPGAAPRPRHARGPGRAGRRGGPGLVRVRRTFRVRRTAPAVPLHADPGLQPERTVMSWGRTVLSLCVCALTLVRWYPQVGAAAFLPAVLAGALGVWVLHGQRHRYDRQSAGIAAEAAPPAWRAVGVLTLMVAVLSLLGLLALVRAGG